MAGPISCKTNPASEAQHDFSTLPIYFKKFAVLLRKHPGNMFGVPSAQKCGSWTLFVSFGCEKVSVPKSFEKCLMKFLGVESSTLLPAVRRSRMDRCVHEIVRAQFY